MRAYRDAGGDPGEDRLIAFYAAYRALVRAKVALLRAAQQPAAEQRARSRERRRAGTAGAGRTVRVAGAAAAGRSSSVECRPRASRRLAQALAELSHLPHLSSDVTRKRLAGIDLRQRASDAAYSAEFNRLTYAELGHHAAKETAACGGALVDATFRHRADRDAFAEAFGDAAPLLFVECRAPVRVRAERAARRDRQPRRVFGCVAVGRPAGALGVGAARRAGARGPRDTTQRP